MEGLLCIGYLWKTCGMFSIFKRPVVKIEDHWKIFNINIPVESGKSMMSRRPLEGLLSPENLGNIFFVKKNCGRSFLSGRRMESLLCLEDK